MRGHSVKGPTWCVESVACRWEEIRTEGCDNHNLVFVSSCRLSTTGALDWGWGGGCEGGGVSMSRDKFKGNLAHKFMDVYFLCFSFHSDISNRLKMKKNLKY